MAGNEAYTTRRCVCGVSVVLYGELLWVALNAGRRIEDTDQTRLGSWFDTLLNLNLVSDVVFISTKNGACVPAIMITSICCLRARRTYLFTDLG